MGPVNVFFLQHEIWGNLDNFYVFHYILALDGPIFKKLVTKLKIF